jgi:uncharacterized protein YlxW (UPF0749 family)
MPPLIIEASLALAIIVSAIKVTTSINSIEQSQKVSKAELMGEIRVIQTDLKTIKEDSKDFRQELKDIRRHRYTDTNNS